MAVGSDANQKSKTRMLKDGTITATGGLKFSECLYLARGEELYRGGKPDTVLTLARTRTRNLTRTPTPTLTPTLTLTLTPTLTPTLTLTLTPTLTPTLTLSLTRQARHGGGAGLRGDRGGQGGGAQAHHRLHLGTV